MITQNLFLGMDTDTAYVLRNNKRYLKLNNGELISSDNESGGTITNSKGNRLNFKFPKSIAPAESKPWLPLIDTEVDPLSIIGAIAIDDYIILFTTLSTTGKTPDSDEEYNCISDTANCTWNISMIWLLKYDRITNSIINSVDNVLAHSDLVYYDRLNFSISNPIYAVANKETEDSIKIYFTDYYNTVRFANVLDSNLINATPSSLDYLNITTLPTIKTTVIDGGSFHSGIVQYSVQFYNYRGTESIYSPPGNAVNLGESQTTMSDTTSFVGSEYNENIFTNKSTKTVIDIKTQEYDYARVVRIYYSTEYAAPEITIVYDGGISGDKIYITDDGNITEGSLSHESFIAAGGTLFRAKSLTSTKNRLLASNIGDTYFDVDYDARTYRFSNTINTSTVYDNDGSFYTISYDGSWTKTGSDGTTNILTGTNFNLPETSDIIVPKYLQQATQKHIAPITSTSDPDLRIGGTGPNIEYVFITNEIKIDGVGTDSADGSKLNFAEDGNVTDQNWSQLIDNSYIDNTSYSGFSSDINSSTISGYQRSETYRFGIVFFDYRGRSSFVKWIGDIMIPNIYDEDKAGTEVIKIRNQDGSFTYSNKYTITTVGLIDNEFGTSATYAYNVGIKFTVKNIPKGVSSFQIVRVQRENSDKTIVAAGMMLPVGKGDDYDGDTQNDYRPVSSIKSYGTAIDVNGVQMFTGGGYKGRSGMNGLANNFGKVDLPSNTGTSDITITTHSITYHDKLFNFISPEITFFKKAIPSFTKIGLYGRIACGVVAYEKNILPSDLLGMYFKSGQTLGLHSTMVTSANDLNLKKSITITDPIKDFIDIGIADNYKHYSYWKTYNGSNHRWLNAYSGSAVIGLTENSISDVVSTIADYDGEIIYAYLKNDNIQYGGNLYENRFYNKYLPASNLINIDSTETEYTVNVFNGDCYIAMFEHARLYPNNDTGARTMHYSMDIDQRDNVVMNTVVFPVESSINIPWRADETYSKASGHRESITERKGEYFLLSKNGSDGIIESFSQNKDAGLINYAYMRSKNVREYFVKPQHFDKKAKTYNHRILISNEKFDGESNDSWLTSKPSNYIDADGTYGSINALEAISGNVYFFQDTAIGNTEVLRESVITDDTNNSLQLGSGTLFSQIRYISNKSGTKYQDSVIRGNNGIYFYDTPTKDIGVINSKGITNLSLQKNISKFLSNTIPNYLLNNPNYLTGFNVYSGMDNGNNNIYFTFKTDVFDMTISYNELYNEFVSFHDFKSKRYISNQDIFISIAEGDMESDSGWIHDEIAIRGSYNGNDPQNTSITFSVADKPSLTKVFDTLEYDNQITSTDNSINYENETFNSIKIENFNLSAEDNPIDAKYRFRTWRVNIPRIVDGTRSGRFIGKYANITLEYINSDNKKIKIFPIVTHWRPLNITNN